MANVRVAFDVLKGVTLEKMREVKLRPVFKYVQTHVFFYIKMDSEFTLKARLVSDRHKMAPP